MMGSSLCLPARGAVVISTSLLRFLLLRTDECMGNGGPGSLIEHSETTGRLGLGLLGLEGDALGSSALLARDRDNQLFLGLGRQRVRAETARGMFDRLDFGDGCDYLVDGSCLPRRRQEKPCQTSRNLLAGACTRSSTFSGRFSFEEKPTEFCLRQQGGIPLPRLIRTLVVLVVLAAEQVPTCSRALGGVSERMLTIFFVSTHEQDQWFCAKRYLILGS
jgi:hypothetical protein